MASLFISYSRRDIEFARRLTEAFKGQELDFWIDWEGIEPTVDWWQEIERGIEQADNFLFLISPDSAASKVCRQEIEHAVKNGKRLIPIVVRDIAASEAPSELRPLNWIFLREEDNFRAAFSKLIKAIKTDYAWVQVHRQLQVKALEWERSNHENSFLLRGKELQDAESQLATNSSKEPHPTDLQREYVLKSRQAADRQRVRNTSITTGAIIIMAILTVIAIVQRGFAQQAQATAEANASAAETARADAVIEANGRATAQAQAEERANIALARQLAAQAQTTYTDHPELSLLLAIEAAHTSEKTLGYYLPITEQSLRKSLSQIQIGGQPLPGLRSNSGSAASTFSPDGRWLAISPGYGRAFLWDLQNTFLPPIALTTEEQTGPVGNIKYSPDGRWLAVSAGDNVSLWDLYNLTLQPILLKTGEEFIEMLEFSQDGRWLETEHEIWDIQDLAKEPMLFPSEAGVWRTSELSPDGHWLAFSSRNEDKIVSLKLQDMRDLTVEPVILYNSATYFNQLMFSPKGGWLVATYFDGKDKLSLLWDIRNISAGPITLGYNDVFGGITFSPDEHWLAISNQNKASVWNLQDVSADPIVISGGPLWFFSHDGHWLFTEAGMWDMNDPSTASIPLKEDGHLEFMDLSPDGHWLSTGNGCYIHLWNTRDLPSGPIILHGHELRSCGPVPNGNWITSQTFSPDGRWLVTTDAVSAVWLWDLQHPLTEPITLPHGSRDEDYYSIDDLVFSPDGDWLITRSNQLVNPSPNAKFEGTVRRWKMQNLSAEPVLTPRADDLVYSPNGRWLGIRSNDEDIFLLWDMQKGASKPLPLNHVNSVVFSPDGRWLATLTKDADGNSVAYLGELQDLSRGVVLLRDGESVHALTFSPDGRWLAIEGVDSQIHLRDLSDTSNNWHWIELPHQGGPGELSFSSSGTWLATTSGEGRKTIDLWNMSDLSLKQIEFSAEIFFFEISPDDHWLAIRLTEEQGIHLFDLKNSFKETALPNMDEDDVRLLDFSPNGQWLVAGSYNGNIHLWDTWNTDGAPIVMLGNREPIDRMIFSDDGQLLVIGTLGGTVFLWDMQHLSAEPVFIKHPNNLTALAISPDRQWLATGGGGYPLLDTGDHTVRLWHLNVKDLLSISCQLVGRNMTRAEWAQYLPDKPYSDRQEDATCPQWPIEPEVTIAPTPTP